MGWIVLKPFNCVCSASGGLVSRGAISSTSLSYIAGVVRCHHIDWHLFFTADNYENLGGRVVIISL